MEFELFERKFKLIDDVLYSFYKHGTSKTEKWHKIKLSDKDGYKRFGFTLKGKEKKFYFHRIMYYAHNPQWNLLDSSKENVIDHIDRNRTNNCISNLRNVSQQENLFNRTRCKGYWFDKRTGKHVAQITLNKKKIHIGYYDTKEEAHQAYLNKKKELHVIRAR